ncbi:MAG: tyrosine-type recombinase/integrase, partial [Methanobacteriaceae archaeon]|nr:tyrosine-type recombinase/integrase [Methanobacteriaceae archaeon]
MTTEDLDLTEKLEEYLDDLTFENLSSITIKNYDCSNTHFIDYLNENKLDITKNTDKILKKYRRYLYTEKHNKYNSINTHLISITQFLNYCNIKAKPPLAKNPNKNKEPKYLTKSEINELLETVPEKNIRDKTIIQTLYHTGLRISELVALNKQDLNLESKESVIEINVIHGKGDKQRKVYINQET